ncbi:hypothetical protein JMJ77_0005788, partial [Colletotrichum scovillei]
ASAYFKVDDVAVAPSKVPRSEALGIDGVRCLRLSETKARLWADFMGKA